MLRKIWGYATMLKDTYLVVKERIIRSECYLS